MKLLLGLIILFLGVILAFQWSNWPYRPVTQLDAGGEESRAPTTSSGAESPLDALSPPDEREEYAVVIDRPLFLPGRRPPSEEPEQEEPPPEQDNELGRLDLSAVIITPAKAIAWVRDPAEKELQDLELGDELNGWTVKDILTDRLVLERQGETNTLTLRDYQNMPQPPSDRTSPRQVRNQEAPSPSRPTDRGSERRSRATRQPPTSSEQQTRKRQGSASEM